MHKPVFYARHLLRLSNMKKKRDAARQARDVHRVKKKSRTLSGKKVDARTYSGSRQMVDRKQRSTIIAEPRTSRKDGGGGGEELVSTLRHRSRRACIRPSTVDINHRAKLY